MITDASNFSLCLQQLSKIYSNCMETIIHGGLSYSFRALGIHVDRKFLSTIYEEKEIARRLVSVCEQTLLTQDKYHLVFHPLHFGDNATVGTNYFVNLLDNLGQTLQTAIVRAEQHTSLLNYLPSQVQSFQDNPALLEFPFQFSTLSVEQLCIAAKHAKIPLTPQSELLLMVALLGTCLRNKIDVAPLMGVALGFVSFPQQLVLEPTDMFPKGFKLLDTNPIMASVAVVDKHVKNFLTCVLTGNEDNHTKFFNWWRFCLYIRYLSNTSLDLCAPFTTDQTKWLKSEQGKLFLNRVPTPIDTGVNWYQELLRLLGIKSRTEDFKKFLKQFIPWLKDINRQMNPTTGNDFVYRFKSSVDYYSIPDCVVINQMKPDWRNWIRNGESQLAGKQ